MKPQINFEKLDKKIDWLEWHYEEFRNPYEFSNYNKLCNQYKVRLFQYCMFCYDNFLILKEYWGALKYLQMYDRENERYDRLKNVLIKAIDECHCIYVRKKINRIKHLRTWIYEYYENYRIERIRKSMHILRSMNVPEDQQIKIATMFRSQIDEIIRFIANDRCSGEKFINKYF